MKILTYYVNCSLGGMTSVYRTRALQSPEVQFDFVFENDRGGRIAFEGLANVNLRVVPKNRVANYLTYLLRTGDYDELRITSNPKLLDQIVVPKSVSVIYEFHSPDAGILRKELKELDPFKTDEVWTPSRWAADLLKSLAPRRTHLTVRPQPNPIDIETFTVEGPVMSFGRSGSVPVSWIGRLENTQKNYLDFLRTIKVLPEQFFGLVVFSLEHSPERMERFLGDAAILGVEDRIQIYGNLPQKRVADFHRGVRDRGGVFYSTSLSESFGYAVYEASLCGCPVVSFDVGPLSAHPLENIELVPVGGVLEAMKAIESLSRNWKKD